MKSVQAHYREHLGLGTDGIHPRDNVSAAGLEVASLSVEQGLVTLVARRVFHGDGSL